MFFRPRPGFRSRGTQSGADAGTQTGSVGHGVGGGEGEDGRSVGQKSRFTEEDTTSATGTMEVDEVAPVSSTTTHAAAALAMVPMQGRMQRPRHDYDMQSQESLRERGSVGGGVDPNPLRLMRETRESAEGAELEDPLASSGGNGQGGGVPRSTSLRGSLQNLHVHDEQMVTSFAQAAGERELRGGVGGAAGGRGGAAAAGGVGMGVGGRAANGRVHGGTQTEESFPVDLRGWLAGRSRDTGTQTQ